MKTTHDVETCLQELRELTSERDRLRVRLAKLTAVLTGRYEPQITGLNKKIAKHEAELQAWATEQKPLFAAGEKKSMSFINGTLGFALSPEGVRTPEPEKWTPKNIIAAMKSKAIGPALRRLFKPFIRVKEEVDKAQILIHYRAGKVTNEQLEVVGMKVERQEYFYVELPAVPAAPVIAAAKAA